MIKLKKSVCPLAKLYPKHRIAAQKNTSVPLSGDTLNGSPFPQEDQQIIRWLSGFTSKIYYQGGAALALLDGKHKFTRQLVVKVNDPQSFAATLQTKKPSLVSSITVQGNFLTFRGTEDPFLVECLNDKAFHRREVLFLSWSLENDTIEHLLYDPIQNELKDPLTDLKMTDVRPF